MNSKGDFEIICSLGEPALLEQLAEECSELAHAALKMARLERGENPTPKTEEECEAALKEELADVILCIDAITQCKKIYNIYDVQYVKQKRWVQRILEAQGKTPKETIGEKKKTRQSEFLKIFPDALEEEGVMNICPLILDKSAKCFKVNCKVCQKDFWLAEVK